MSFHASCLSHGLSQPSCTALAEVYIADDIVIELKWINLTIEAMFVYSDTFLSDCWAYD